MSITVDFVVAIINGMSIKSKIQDTSSPEFTLWFFGIIIVVAIVLYIWQAIFGSPISRAPEETINQEKNILVDAPKPEEEIGLPFTISGEARVFENNVNVVLKDRTGTVLLEDIILADAPEVGEFGKLEKNFSYLEPQTNSGTLEVFSLSAENGTRINENVIPVKFKKVQSKIIKIFLKKLSEGQFENCEDVVSVERRIVDDVNALKRAIEELVRGPTIIDIQNNLATNISTEAKLLGVVIQDGIARADFDSNFLSLVENTCSKKILREQLEQTLRQFSGIEEVIISVEGKINAF